MNNNEIESKIKEICKNNPKNFTNILKNPKNRDIFNYIMEKTNFITKKEHELGIHYTMSTRICLVLNHVDDFPKCDCCGKEVYGFTKMKWFKNYPNYCYNDNVCKNRSPKMKKKMENGVLKKYGVKHPAQNTEILNKMKNTYLERTGYSNPSFNPNVVEKIREKTKNNMMSTLEKIKYTNREKYGVDWFVQSEEYKKKVNVCSGKSKEEKEMIEYIRTLTDKKMIIGSFKIIYPQQLDVYIPDLNIAFEFNGTYFHSMEFGDKDLFYHLNKTRKCEQKDIKLIHIWEDEWDNGIAKEIIKNVLCGTIIFDNSKDVIEIDRSIYNSCWKIDGYELIGESEPEIILRDKRNYSKYKVPNCGKLIYRKIN